MIAATSARTGAVVSVVVVSVVVVSSLVVVVSPVPEPAVVDSSFSPLQEMMVRLKHKTSNICKIFFKIS